MLSYVPKTFSGGVSFSGDRQGPSPGVYKPFDIFISINLKGRTSKKQNIKFLSYFLP
jgi:hypothetical protein